MKKPRKKQSIPNGLTFYNSHGEKRWRLYRNGRKIGASTQGYSNLTDAANNARSTREMFSEFAINKALTAYKNRTK